ncbi:MAG: hypothetical protein M3P15_00905 [Actinomycetota bacterium]|nr:hypothetical protein [Actinomycetota bacterium]
MKRDLLAAANPQRPESPLVLQSAEFSFHCGAAPVEIAPPLRLTRATYVDERARTGVAGFGEFDFRFGNSAPTVMHDVMSALAAAVGVGA